MKRVQFIVIASLLSFIALTGVFLSVQYVTRSPARSFEIPPVQAEGSSSISLDEPHLPTYAWETQVLSLIDSKRATLGLHSLHQTYPLVMSARSHAADMASIDSCQHESVQSSSEWGPGFAERLNAVNWQGTYWGEVLACRYGTPVQAVDGLWASPTHYAILTIPSLTEIGCGASLKDVGNTFLACIVGTVRVERR